MMSEFTRLKTIHFAAAAHDGQYRRASPGVPYIIHPIAVGNRLISVGAPENAIIAGYLHDTVEDTDITLEDIEQKFGLEIANIVDYVSERKRDDKNEPIPWEDRKRLYIDRLFSDEAPLEARMVSIADKVDNVSDILYLLDRDGDDAWSSFTATKAQQSKRYDVMIHHFEREDDPTIRTLLSELKDVCDSVYRN